MGELTALPESQTISWNKGGLLLKEEKAGDAR